MENFDFYIFLDKINTEYKKLFYKIKKDFEFYNLKNDEYLEQINIIFNKYAKKIRSLKYNNVIDYILIENRSIYENKNNQFLSYFFTGKILENILGILDNLEIGNLIYLFGHDDNILKNINFYVYNDLIKLDLSSISDEQLTILFNKQLLEKLPY